MILKYQSVIWSFIHNGPLMFLLGLLWIGFVTTSPLSEEILLSKSSSRTFYICNATLELIIIVVSTQLLKNIFVVKFNIFYFKMFTNLYVERIWLVGNKLPSYIVMLLWIANVTGLWNFIDIELINNLSIERLFLFNVRNRLKYIPVIFLSLIFKSMILVSNF